MFQEANSQIIVYYLAGTLFFTILIVAIIFYIFIHQKRVNSFRTQLKQEEIRRQKAIYVALQDGEVKERKRIAQELHDGISAKLSGYNMNLEYLKTAGGNKGSEDLLDKTFDGITGIINELRALSHNLHSNYFDNRDIKALLDEYIEQLNQRGVCQYFVYIETDLHSLNGYVRLHVYRIIIELLHNIDKHARATEGSVQITNDGTHLVIIASDNGVGFNKTYSTGIGLTNIHNRVSASNGTINIDSSDNGTTIIIELPIEE